MSGCHVPEVKCECLCHGIQWPDDYDFSGSVCCKCHRNKLNTELPLTMHPKQVLVDKFEDRIKRIEDFHIRNFNERIESLESQMKASTEMYKHILISIAGLRDHHVRQIDENRKISTRVDDVIKEIVNQSSIAEKYSIDHESRIEKLEDNLKIDDRISASDVLCRLTKLESNQEWDKFINYKYKVDNEIILERLNNLESDHLDKLDPHAFLILKIRCDELETKYNDLLNFKNVAFTKYNLKPHTCPVCEGKGKDSNRLIPESYDQQIKVLVNPDCKPCEGKGIVWG